MKKLSALMALLLCVIIGGVYAAGWYYTEGGDITDRHSVVDITIPERVVQGAEGEFTATSNFKLVVNQANDAHDAELLFEPLTEGEEIKIRLTFKANINASEDVKENGVPARYFLETSTAMQYTVDAEGNYSSTGTPTDIFVLSPEHETPFAANILKVNATEAGTKWTYDSVNDIFFVEFGEAQIKEMIKLNTVTVDGEKVPFRLDIPSEHEMFMKSLGGDIYVYISDGIHATAE